MDTFNLSYSLINSINHNSEFLRLFKQTAFLIYRNTYGGLSQHEIEALYTIKKKLSGHIQEQDKAYLTKLIDALSLYDLPYILTKATSNAILEKELFNFIASQRQSDLCDILIEHIKQSNALYLSIENNQNALTHVQDLIKFSENNTPLKFTDPMPQADNIWRLIKNANELPDGFIHIAFIMDDENEAQLLCLKGLCMAETYLQSIQVAEEVKERREKIIKPFAPKFAHGIVSLTSSIFGNKLSSKITFTESQTLEEQLAQIEYILDIGSILDESHDDFDAEAVAWRASLNKKELKQMQSERKRIHRMLDFKEKQQQKEQRELAKLEANTNDNRDTGGQVEDDDINPINTNTALIAALQGSNLPQDNQDELEPTPLFSSFKGQGHFDIEQGFLFIIT